jgi:hypothetical protein
MTARDLIKLLSLYPDMEIYINTPDREQNFFVDSISINAIENQLFIETAE